MDIHTSRPRVFPAVTVVALLLFLCVVLGQFLVAPLLPGIAGLVRIDPSIVFLDIPVSLPVVDLVLVSGLFLLVYPLIVVLYPSRPGLAPRRQAMRRLRSAFTGLLLVLICTVAGGLIYYYAQDHFSRAFRTGINSFGINVDMHFPYPGYETVQLRGSTIILVCFLIGLWICIRKIRKEPGAQKAVPLTRDQRMTPYERMVQQKRMKEKPTGRPPAAAKPAIKKPAVNKQPAVVQQATPSIGNRSPAAVCRSQPVAACKPEAVGYMPML